MSQANGVPARAVVFGGAGFIGTHLLRELADGGAQRLVSADVAPPERRVPGVEYVSCDVRRPIELAGDFDVVINLAAVHRTPGHPDADYFETNVRGALTVTEFCRRHGIGDLVFTSSISVYGPSEEERNESSPLEPTSAYGRSKAIAEDIHRQWVEEDAARHLVIARPAVTFGPGEHGNFDRLYRSLRAGTFVYPGRLDTIKSCGHVTDLVGSLLWARLLPDPAPQFNFSYPARTTIEQIATTIADVGGFRAPRLRVPRAMLLTVARGFEAAGSPAGINRARVMKLVESTNVVPQFLETRGYPYRTDLRSGVELWLREAAL